MLKPVTFVLVDHDRRLVHILTVHDCTETEVQERGEYLSERLDVGPNWSAIEGETTVYHSLTLAQALAAKRARTTLEE